MIEIRDGTMYVTNPDGYSETITRLKDSQGRPVSLRRAELVVEWVGLAQGLPAALMDHVGDVVVRMNEADNLRLSGAWIHEMEQNTDGYARATIIGTP
jgi:hypothetical protein